MMTTRKKGGTPDYKSNHEIKGNEVYDTYYGEDTFLRSSLFESEKQQLESRIRELELRSKAVECKNTIIIVSITVLFIANLTISSYIIHQLNIEQMNAEIIHHKDVEQSQATSRKANLIPREGWKVC